MLIYFWLIRLAAWLGNKKAQLLADGQARALDEIRAYEQQHPGRSLRGAIWVHAASVGEFEQARPLIEQIRKTQPHRPILLTFFSPSGYEMRKYYGQVDLVCYLPFATRANARKWIELVAPSVAIMVKYEFWPAYLKQLQKAKVTTYLISAIFRPTQLFFRPWGKSYRRLLEVFTRIFVQDEASKELLAKYGIRSVEVAGDTRFDRVAAISADVKPIAIVEQFIAGCGSVIVAGSTWPKDEQLLARYVKAHPGVKLVLVPHEIDEEHLHEIFQLFQGRHVRYTQASAVNLQHVQTLVVDTMGLLSSIYQYAHVAYIGGGFGVGIHNTIEAAVYGLPVVFGPNYQAFREAKGLIEAGSGCSISDYQELEQTFDTMLQERITLGQKSSQYVRSELGATERILKQLIINN